MDILPSKLKQHFVGRFFQLNQNAIKMKVHRCEYAITTQYKRHDRGFKNGYHRLDDSFAKMTILVKRWLFFVFDRHFDKRLDQNRKIEFHNFLDHVIPRRMSPHTTL